MRSLHRLDEASEAFRKALELAPTSRLPRSTWERRGSWQAITPAGGSAIDTHGELWRSSLPRTIFPEWNGVPIPGKSLLVYDDQGFGDTIQFARFLSACRERSAAQIFLSCQSALTSLFAGLPGVDVLYANDEPVPDCDFQVPIASLPGLLGATIESVGIGVPYLSSPRELRPEIAALFEQTDRDAVRIGLVWQGNPKQTRDIVRSCPLEKLSPLLTTNRARFFNLQTGEPGRLQIKGAQTERSADRCWRFVDQLCGYCRRPEPARSRHHGRHGDGSSRRSLAGRSGRCCATPPTGGGTSIGLIPPGIQRCDSFASRVTVTGTRW